MTRRLLDVELHNYGSYLHERLKLAGRGRALLLGTNLDDPVSPSNGTGKSTLLEAIDWCLFGDVPKGDAADSVVNHKAGLDCWVKVRIQDDEDGTVALVHRGRKVQVDKDGRKVRGNLVAFQMGEENRSTLDPDETQRRICEWLGMDRQVFLASAMFSQGERFRFAEASESDRVEILSKVEPGLLEVDAWQQRAKERRQEEEKQAQAAGVAVARLEGESAALVTVSYAEKSTQWEAERAERVQRSTELVVEAERDVQRAHAELAALPVVAEPAPLGPNLELSTLEAAVREASQAGLQCAGTVGVLRERIRSVEQQRSRMQALTGTTCGACGQQVGPGHVQVEEARLQQELQAHQQELQRVLDSQVGWQAAQLEREHALLASRQARAAQDAEYAATVQRSRGAAAARQQQQLHLQRFELELGRRRAALQQEAVAANPFQKMEEDRLLRLEVVRQELQMQSRSRLVHEDAARYYLWVEKAPIKSHVLDQKVGEVSQEANRWCALLTDKRVWVKVDTQTPVKGGKELRDKIRVRVFRHEPDGTVSERDYRSFSGGERQRVALALDFGLARLVAARAFQRMSFLGIDEAFMHLDAGGREALVRVLAELEQERDTILVVDHDAEFQGAFREVVHVQKQGGQSRIVSGSGFDAPALLLVPVGA